MSQKQIAQKPVQSPAALAKHHVDEWIDALISSTDFGERMDPFMNDEAFDDVARAIEATMERAQNPTTADERHGQQLLAEREAGYLIGVQVGLRLRQVQR